LNGCREKTEIATKNVCALVVLLGAAIGQFVASTATKNCLRCWPMELADSRDTEQMAPKEVPLSDPLPPNFYGYWLLVQVCLALVHDAEEEIKIKDFWNI
jgi:hypothetical protein